MTDLIERPAGGDVIEPELLFPEAQQRARRRHLWAAGSLALAVALAAVVGAIVLAGGGGGSGTPPSTPSHASPPPSAGGHVNPPSNAPSSNPSQTTPPTQAATPPDAASTTPPPTALSSAFVGSWAMHDGSIAIGADGVGQLEWPGVTVPIGVTQVAQIAASSGSDSQATVTITSGELAFPGPSSTSPDQTFGPGSVFTLSPTSFGFDLSSNGQHLYYFCSVAEMQAGQDQQYCGA